MLRFTKEEMKKIKRLYHNLPWRIAKKWLADSRLYKLIGAVDLKPGDLISTCKGYNEVIEEIRPEIYQINKGWVVSDFSVQTAGPNGGNCSVLHCCTFPLETKEEVAKYWLSHQGPEYDKWVTNWYGGDIDRYFESPGYKMVQLLNAGKEVFLPDGQLNPDWNKL